MSAYRKACQETLAKIGRSDVPPEVMEASMRLQYGTLDHLDRRTFRTEATVAAGMWDQDREGCTRLAESYGLPITEEGERTMPKKHATEQTTDQEQTSPEPATQTTESAPEPTASATAEPEVKTRKRRKTETAPERAEGVTEAPSGATDAAPRPRRRPTRDAAEPGPTSPTDATQPGLAPANADDGELVVFAFRLTRAERDLIHAAAGSARASRFVRGLAVAAARGDVPTIEALVAETMTK